MLLGVPRSSSEEEVLSFSELTDEPEDHQAITPVGQQRSPGHGVLATALRVGASKKVLGLPVRYFDAPAVGEPVDGLLVGSVDICVEQGSIGVIPIRVTNETNRDGFITTD